MKKVIYFCKCGEAVSDWNITETVDWICNFKIDNIPFYFENNTDWYVKHLLIYFNNCIDNNIKNEITISKIDEYALENKVVFFFSTHLIIDEIRARITEGRINKDDYEFWIEDSVGKLHLKNINIDGRSNDWYDTEDVMDNILIRLIHI